MWFSLKKILPFTINKLGIKGKIDAHRIFQVWSELMNKKYPDKTKPLSFQRGFLIVGCKNSVLAAELRLQQENILKDINKQTTLVKKIKFICQ